MPPVWLAETPAEHQWWSAICWSPELHLFCAVNATPDALDFHRVMTSPDGVNWTIQTAPKSIDYVSICWSPQLHLFVAVANSGDTGLDVDRVMTSPDGIHWTARSAPEPNSWQGVCWSPALGLFVAVAAGPFLFGTHLIMTSPDGINWSTQDEPAGEELSHTWQGLAWSPDLTLFCAVATPDPSGETAMTSPDGVNWTIQTCPGTSSTNGSNPIAWSGALGLFCSVGDGAAPGNIMLTSPDGANWTQQTIAGHPNCAPNAVAWSPDLGLFVGVPFPTIFPADNVAVSSPDGINWTARVIPDPNNSWDGVAWSPELGIFAAVSGNGDSDTAFQVMIGEVPLPLVIVCDNPPVGKIGSAYSHTFPASGGVPDYTFSISAGSLPPGTSLDPATGIVSGISTTSGSFEFAITATDSVDATATVGCSIIIKTCLVDS